ncbi:MAG: hypothetical protein GY941_21815 [Planctomycetes bacterium]|nr:hypothetical protein [Planctomycetota bacterium]
MNRYEIINCIGLIKGYHTPRPNELQEEAFVRAKNELISNLQKQLNNVKTVSFSEFTNKKY